MPLIPSRLSACQRQKSGRPGINPGARLFLVLLIIAGSRRAGNWKWLARAAGFAAPAAHLSHRFSRLACVANRCRLRASWPIGAGASCREIHRVVVHLELVQHSRKMSHREVIEIAVGIAHKLGCNLAHANDIVNAWLHVEVGLRPAGVVGVGVSDVGRLSVVVGAAIRP
jgi:hypothetical protein